MGALVDINTDGLAKLAQIVGNWLGLEARAIERNADANAFASVRKTEAENAAALIRLQGEEQVANYMLAREKRKLNNTISVTYNYIFGFIWISKIFINNLLTTNNT